MERVRRQNSLLAAQLLQAHRDHIAPDDIEILESVSSRDDSLDWGRDPIGRLERLEAEFMAADLAAVDDQTIRDLKVDEDSITAKYFRYWTALMRAGLRMQENEGSPRRYKVVIEDPDFAILWFQDALDAYAEAHPDKT